MISLGSKIELQLFGTECLFCFFSWYTHRTGGLKYPVNAWKCQNGKFSPKWSAGLIFPYSNYDSKCFSIPKI